MRIQHWYVVFCLVMATAVHPGAVPLPVEARTGLPELAQRPPAAASSSVSPPLLRVALVLDTSARMQGKQTTLQDAAIQLVRSLGPRDEVGIISFGLRISANPFTSDKRALELAIRATDAKGAGQLFNAVYIGLRELQKQNMQGEERQSALVVFSRGEDLGSLASADDVVSRAAQGAARLYAVFLRGDGSEARPGESESMLRQLATASGGRFFLVGTTERVADAFAQIVVELPSMRTSTASGVAMQPSGSIAPPGSATFTKQPRPIGIGQDPERPWMVPALLSNGTRELTDETAIKHRRKDCAATRGRKLMKWSSGFFSGRRDLALCEICRPSEEQIATAELWSIDDTDKTYVTRVHAYHERHPEIVIRELSDNPDGASKRLVHYNESCPLASDRILESVSLKEFNNGHADLNLCPKCKLDHPGTPPKALYRVDISAEYHRDHGLPPLRSNREKAGWTELIKGITDAAIVASGGTPPSTHGSPLSRSGVLPATSAAQSPHQTGQCVYSLSTAGGYSPSRANVERSVTVYFDESGGVFQVTVSATPSACRWSLRPETDSWARVVGPLQGTGDASVQIVVEPLERRGTEWLGRWSGAIRLLGTNSLEPGALVSSGITTRDGIDSVGLHQCGAGVTAAECAIRSANDRR